MKSNITLTIIFLISLASSFAFAQVQTESESSTAEVIYRCEATGLNRERQWVTGENENSLLKWAQAGALRACQRKGGIECKITHCFKELIRRELLSTEE